MGDLKSKFLSILFFCVLFFFGTIKTGGRSRTQKLFKRSSILLLLLSKNV